ncbi:MAG: iron-containing alcohol dehydrogenase [Clostridium sp.]|nr:iron-containing alcohol dehydrogenase [Clostridium sp.]
MKNFDYSIPTKVHFGKGQIQNLALSIKEYGNNVLLVYGGGSIKRIGLYDNIIKIIRDAEISYVELSGVEPNPSIEKVCEGVEACKENNIDVVLAVGGGSTIDCAKVIAAGANYDGDPWDLVLNPSKIDKVLPIITILTLSATGSEMDEYAVISNVETNDKIGTGHRDMRPKVSILDPEYTYTVPKDQTAAGTADIMSHIFESYFNTGNSIDIQDGISETLLKTCIKYGEIAYNDPNNYEARANLMWASSLALNGLISYGTDNNAWSVHPMEHELSAYYNITHGIGLAILTPFWMKYILNDDTVDRFAKYGVNVWGIDSSLDKYTIANRAIKRTYNFFRKLNMPSTLSEVGIGTENLNVMAMKAAKGLDNAYVPLDEKDVLNIFKAAL